MTDPAAVAVDLLVVHGVVITVDPARRIYLDGAVAISGGRILAVGPTRDLAAQYLPDRTIDAHGAVVRPGFVDAHVHLSHHLGRGSIPDIWPEEREHEQWLPYWLHLSDRDAYLSALLACLEMVCNGTTTFSDMSGRHSADLRARAAADVGIRGLVSEICWDIPPHPEVAEGDTAANTRRLERLVADHPIRPNSLTWAGVAMTGMGKCTDELIVAGHDLARRTGLPFTMHQSFGLADTAAFARRTPGRTSIEHLDRLGVLGPETSLIHMNVVTEVEERLLASSGTSIVHCPGASLRVGMGGTRHGRFPELVAAGVPVALGSDSGNYADFFDIGRQLYLAATIHREARGVMPTITAEQAVEMATVHGARALRADDRIGSIEAGRFADIVIHSPNRPEWFPGVDPVNSLVYSGQSNGVDTVLVGGEVVVAGGRPVRIDVEAALGEIDASARSLFARMGYEVEQRWPIIR